MLAAGPHPHSGVFSPQFHIPFSLDPFQYYLYIYSCAIFRTISSFTALIYILGKHLPPDPAGMVYQ